MERLTFKEKTISNILYDTGYSNDVCIDKLGHTEDIEEKHNMSVDEMDAYITEHKKIEQELGIELSVLFKARNGFYVHGDYEEIVEIADDLWINIVSEMLGGTVIETDDLGKGQVSHVYRYFEDYGKTWALTKEELEK